MSDLNPELRLAALVGVAPVPDAAAADAGEVSLTAATALAERVRVALEKHGGELLQRNEVAYVLEFPDAESALAAGEELAAGHWPRASVGVHLGGVMRKRGGQLYGQGLHVAERVRQTATPGALLATDVIKAALKGGPLANRLTPEAELVIDETNRKFQLYRLQPPTPQRLLKQRRARRLWIAVSAGIVLTLAAASVWLEREPLGLAPPRREKVAVLPLQALGRAAASAQFAADLTQEVRQVLNRGGAAAFVGEDAELRGPARARAAQRLGVAVMLDGRVLGADPSVTVDMSLADPIAGRALWSHEFRGSIEDLEAQAPARVINVLNCAAKALRRRAGLSSDDALSLFLLYCDLDEDVASDPTQMSRQEAVLNKLQQMAPTFSYTYSALAAFHRGKLALGGLSPDGAARLRDQAEAEANRALDLDRDNADGYTVQALLIPTQDWLQRDKLLSAAAALPSAGVDPPGQYALLLGEVGRLQEAVANWSKSVAANPFEPDYTALGARALGATGRLDAALDALDKSRRIAPDNATVLHTLFEIDQWAGRWDDAARILDEEAFRIPALGRQLDIEDDRTAFKAFLAAARSRDPIQIASAREAEFDAVKSDPAHLITAMSHLAALGLVDDAYALAQSHMTPLMGLTTLFAPPAAALRQDPRFIAFTARLGLLDYWRQSGRWPEFCRQPGLPYSCESEGAKFPAK